MLVLLGIAASVLFTLGLMALMMTEAGATALICAIVTVAGIIGAPFLRMERERGDE